MIDYKEKYNLKGNDLWPSVYSVFIKGIPNEPDIDHSRLSDENENIINSWENVVVLKATSEKPTLFYIGFSHERSMKYLDFELETNITFALRLGPNNIRFFVMPKDDLSTEVNLEVIEQTKESDPKYSDIIIF